MKEKKMQKTGILSSEIAILRLGQCETEYSTTNYIMQALTKNPMPLPFPTPTPH